MEQPPTMGLPSVVTEWHAPLWPVACRVRRGTPIRRVMHPVLIIPNRCFYEARHTAIWNATNRTSLAIGRLGVGPYPYRQTETFSL